MFQIHLNYFSSLLPIKFVSFLKKKGKKSIICCCRCADVQTDTNNKGDALVCNPQWRQHPKSSLKKQKSKIFALAEKRALYILWDRLKQEALCNSLVFGYDACIQIDWYVGGAKGPLPDSNLKVSCRDTSW